MTEVPHCYFESDNAYDIPALKLALCADFPPDQPLVPWGARASRRRAAGTIHFYTDDYRFSALWRRPDTVLKTNAPTIVEPNFTIDPEMPAAVVMYQLYRKRWLARYWQQHGLRIFVDLNVPARYADLNLVGVPAGWRAFATRAYARQADAILAEWSRACHIAGTDDVIFFVYGGGSAARDICQDIGAYWYSNQWDEA